MAKYVLTTLAPVPRLIRVDDGAECIRFSKQLAVLAYLVSRPQARATRDELVGLLWGGPAQSDGRRALRQVVYQIRHATDHDLLRGDDVLTLRREDVEADADVFRLRASTGEFESALAVYEQDAPTDCTRVETLTIFISGVRQRFDTGGRGTAPRWISTRGRKSTTAGRRCTSSSSARRGMRDSMHGSSSLS